MKLYKKLKNGHEGSNSMGYEKIQGRFGGGERNEMLKHIINFVGAHTPAMKNTTFRNEH